MALFDFPDPNATAEKAFGTSILISTVRCLLTYVLLPLLKPVVDLSGGVGPILGLVIGSVSAIAIVYSMRRFWRYASAVDAGSIGSGTPRTSYAWKPVAVGTSATG